MEHTPHALTYVDVNRDPDQIGDNWLVAVVDFGTEGQYHITTSGVHGSDLVMGDAEADVALWCAAAEMLASLEAIVEAARMSDQPRARYCGEIAAAAIAKARPQANESADR